MARARIAHLLILRVTGADTGLREGKGTRERILIDYRCIQTIRTLLPKKPVKVNRAIHSREIQHS
jgi:hypothetical protein